MDPLSVTASVIAVLQAANSVMAVCYDFRAAIKDRPWALTRITNSINELRLILGRLEEAANESELKLDDMSVARLSTLESLCQEGGTIRNCYDELIALERKLGSGNWAGKEGSKRKALIQSIGWQYKGKDVEDVLKKLEGYKSTLNLAINMDQSALIKNISKTLIDVDESTRSFFLQFQNKTLDDRKRNILHWLSPVDPSASHKTALGIHQAGTNKWFLSSKEFKDWQKSETSFLWLSGFPGSGKTILMSTVIEFLQQSNSTIVAYFYCDFRNPETRDSLNIAGSLLAQICFKLASFPVALDQAFERSKMSASPYGKRTDLDAIVEILIKITSQHRVAIIIDALDECENREEILAFVGKLARQKILLKILLSSRDETDIRQNLTDFPRIRLEDSSARLDNDISNYINYRLGHNRAFKWLKPSFKQTIQERLSTRAKGM